MFHKLAERLKNSPTLANYRKIYPYVKPYWGRALLAVLITIPIGSFDALTAWILKPTGLRNSVQEGLSMPTTFTRSFVTR